MSGAIVIDGIERYVPELQHMRERILVLRDQVIGKDDPASPELMRKVELSGESCSTSTDVPERHLHGKRCRATANPHCCG
jgi:suppressor of ftsI